MKTIGLICLMCIFLFSACTAPEPKESTAPSPAAAETAAPMPEPTAAPDPPDAEALLADFVYDGIPQEALYPEEEARSYETVLQHPEVMQTLKDAFAAWQEAICAVLEQEFSAYYGTRWEGITTEEPKWQMLAAAALSAGSPEELADVFSKLVSVEEADGKEHTALVMRNKTPQEAFPMPEEKGSPIPTEFFTSTYLLTVYDEAGELRENSGELAVLSEQITFPFTQRYEFWDGWYLDRDGGARRHTGTDILCPEGTPELACVDGKILAVGSGEGTGNYVVLQGADGTQYHYYHMVELSAFVSAGDTVKRGQVIGLAGNTGNSTADHLHLSIVVPEGVYLNPYPYLAEAQDPPTEVE